MRKKFKKALIVIISVIVLIICFALYDEYKSLKDDSVVGAYESYKKMQYNIDTGKSTPIITKNGKFYIETKRPDLTCDDKVVRRLISESYGVITLIRSLGLATDNGVDHRTVPSKAILCLSVHANLSMSYHLAWDNSEKTYIKDVTEEVTEPR
tara:strand:+ start:4334 stop:4792 length:459 start_codon:yes stop_codon:yes gene_type:complete